MARMQIYLPENLILDLKNEATLQETSMSEIVRKGLKVVLSKKDSDLFACLAGRAKTKRKTDAVKEVRNLYLDKR